MDTSTTTSTPSTTAEQPLEQPPKTLPKAFADFGRELDETARASGSVPQGSAPFAQFGAQEWQKLSARLDETAQDLSQRLDREIANRVAACNTVAARNRDSAIGVKGRIDALEARLVAESAHARFWIRALLCACASLVGIGMVFALVHTQ